MTAYSNFIEKIHCGNNFFTSQIYFIELVPGIRIPSEGSGIFPPCKEETHPIKVRIRKAELKSPNRSNG